VSDVAQSCKIRAMPTFQFYKAGSKIGEVVGADIESVNYYFLIKIKRLKN
jgi:hypothetical protein